MTITETKKYIKRDRFINDLISYTLGVCVILVLLLLIVFGSATYVKESEKVMVVRDTIYLKQEVSIKGPQGYIEYINERHPLELTTSDGKYIIKLTNP